jgi:hypothetical protein
MIRVGLGGVVRGTLARELPGASAPLAAPSVAHATESLPA